MFSDSASTILAVSNRRVEGFMTDYAVGVYLTRTTNKTPGRPSRHRPGLDRSRRDRDRERTTTSWLSAIQAALQSMMDDGSYAKVLAKWGIGDRALKKATINDGQECRSARRWT